VLQDLVSKGLSRVAIFVTDDFSGLRKLLPQFFLLSDHQLCFVHLNRNLKKEFGNNREQNKILERIKEIRQRKLIPNIRANLYRINQLMSIKVWH